MKNLLLAAALLSVIGTGCKKVNETVNKTTSTNDLNGKWQVDIWDTKPVTAPSTAVYNTVATSTTTGTVHMDLSFDGTTHRTEDDTYVLSANNTSVSFTKTGGNWDALSAHNPWTVKQLTPKLFVMTSNGIDVSMTQP